MKTVEFLKGWEKNFTTIFLEHRIFKNEKDEIDKVTKILSLFSQFNITLKFIIEENDKFYKEFLSDKNYAYKIIHTGKRFFSRKKYYTIEINTDIKSANPLIALAIKYQNTVDFEITSNEQIIVSGVLFGDAGGSHTIHFNTKFFNENETEIKINSIFN